LVPDSCFESAELKRVMVPGDFGLPDSIFPSSCTVLRVPLSDQINQDLREVSARGPQYEARIETLTQQTLQQQNEIQTLIQRTLRQQNKIETLTQQHQLAIQDLRQQNLGQQGLIDQLMQGMRDLVAQVQILQQGLESMRTQEGEARAVINYFLKVMGEPLEIPITKDILRLGWIQPSQSRELVGAMKQLREICPVVSGCLSLPGTTDPGCFLVAPHPQIKSDATLLQCATVA
jgi:hypothetical protein